MAEEKDIVHTQVDSASGQTHLNETEEETDAVLLDVGLANLDSGAYSSLELAKDGHTVLVPQPSSDPQDPLNWPWRKKHIMLLIVAFTALLGDYASAAGIPTIVVQGELWNMSPNQVNYAGNLNVIMLGIGGLIWIPVCSWWGRAPIMFWTTLSGALFTLACAVTSSFPVFYGFRALMGFALTSYQVAGLACIKDMFYYHEHARKIGIWVALFIISPYISPFLGNFILAGTGGNSPIGGDWRAVFWMVFGTCCLDLVLIVLFADETWYNRSIPPSQQPARGTRLLRVIGVWQIKNHKGYFRSLWTCVKRLFSVLIKPIIIPSMLYYIMSFTWSVGINITSTILLETPVVAGGYGFSPKAIGYLYFTPLISVVLGETFGHFFNDFLARRYIRTHNGLFKPEARLTPIYVATIFTIPGLVLVGQALHKHLNYWAIVFGWGMFVFGTMIASVAITAYVLDAYPTASPEVAGLLNFSRVLGGFTVGYYQEPLGAAIGYNASFGIQAAIVGLGLIFAVCLQRFGGTLRHRGGPVGWSK